MKIAVLGPISTGDYFGGVATFNEAIATSFQKLGHEVRVMTLQSKLSSDTAFCVTSGTKSKLVAELRCFKPDIVIASLQYGTLFSRRITGKKILFLHGFFNFSRYGVIKTLLAVLMTKYMAQRSDAVFANSSFTAAINRTVWGIDVDQIVNLGIDTRFLSHLSVEGQITNAANGVLLYAGRLTQGKGVDKILYAVHRLREKGHCYKVRIVGDGPARENLESLSKELMIPAEFLGRVAYESMYSVYSSAEVFVSMHETESFGLTFLEAILSGCKVVCPNTGGQISFLSNHQDRVFLANGRENDELERCIQRAFEQKVENLDTSSLIDRYSYDTVCKRILSLAEGDFLHASTAY